MKLYEYIYYSLYQLLQKTAYNDVAEYTACFLLTLIEVCNIAMLFRVLGLNIPILYGLNVKVYGLFIVIPILIFNIIYFIRRKRFERIIAKYSGEKSAQTAVRNVVAVFLLLESLLPPFFY